MRQTLEADIRWGLKIALTYAFGYAALASVMYFVTGGTGLARLDLSLSTVLLVFAAAGAGVGTLVGVLRPWLRSSFGAALVGVIAACPMSILLLSVVSKGRQFGVREVVLASLLFGIGGSIALRRGRVGESD